MPYNPYDLVSLVLNGHSVYGRPTAFDSDVVDQKSMKNSFGNYVKPTQVSSTCPDCGQGLVIDVILAGPPFSPYEYACPLCNPPPEPMPDPFINPLESLKITTNDLDPSLHNVNKPAIPITTTVAERLQQSAEEGSGVKVKTKSKAKAKAQKKQALQSQVEEKNENDFIEYADDKHSKKRLEPAEGISAELEFNDDDLVEP